MQAYPWAAPRACIGLGMETPVPWIFIFSAAGGTQGKGGHGSVGSVIGNFSDDGHPRPAVGAVGEGIVKAPIAGRKNISQAIVTGGDVRGDKRCRATGILAGANDKSGSRLRSLVGRNSHIGDAGQRRR